MTEKKPLFEFKNIHVSVEGNEVVSGVSLKIAAGEIHAIMGPNGSGKSSLSNALMGHPAYTITQGEAFIDGVSILDMATDQRSQAGLFLAFQYPLAIPGVSVANFMRAALKSHRGPDADMSDFRKLFKAEMKALSVDESFASRYLNDGFSGGEKKRVEVLQMSILKPRIALLDETDSGLDIDALKVVSKGINRFSSEENGILLVTHYQRLLNYVKPNYVHVMMDGKLVKHGGPELALKLEESGYDWVEEETSSKAEV
ncbi:MAG: Fe-S cluster assembly ATPase SufC [candidate division Zixibacteria bacterium]|nr:Fe-S cluster assembly ATPase SufC [candidate division Zixibacteria bacterium]MDH3936900.1 Fe-S cluster assembly ATPase SufC [candidate division Zixibacteria bacterium]MDH4034045.1 Fe-S cluster assembly ATPase SufC [candidate division Zixibacteria bacterium]